MGYFRIGTAPAAGAASRARDALAGLWRDRRGVAAVEFGLLVPLLIGLYFVSMEVSQGIETSKKVSRAGSMIADLVTQQSAVSKSEVEAILKIGEALLQPYNRSQPTLTVTGIAINKDASPKALVTWSRKLEKGSYSAGETKDAEVTIPEKLKIAGTFLIRVESRLRYTPVIAWATADRPALGLAAAFDKIGMGDNYYLRPRMSDTVSCADC